MARLGGDRWSTRKQPEKSDRGIPPGRVDGRDRCQWLREINTRQEDTLPCDRANERVRGREPRQVRSPRWRLLKDYAGGVCRSEPDRQIVAFEPGQLCKGIRSHPPVVCGSDIGQTTRIQTLAFLLQRRGRTL